MRRRPRSQRLVAEINITPFTDVILVLLIIFMVSTPLIFRSSLKVSLPQSSTMQEPPRTIAVTINSAGEAFLDNTKYNLRYDLDILKFKLTSLVKNTPDSSITIDGDKTVRYEFIVKVVDIASGVGIRHIVLGTELKH
ncbi:MAG TPA: biopolymer transporter ExbD [Candidatus Omnitrophota bacterium]|nr:biopolymer transporter ExbD [Candidatus Omnitrophota bacterium]HPT07840.1 biopolymer transporter ExbD [Candidatus Omnitrophota bacterium]